MLAVKSNAPVRAHRDAPHGQLLAEEALDSARELRDTAWRRGSGWSQRGRRQPATQLAEGELARDEAGRQGIHEVLAPAVREQERRRDRDSRVERARRPLARAGESVQPQRPALDRGKVSAQQRGLPPGHGPGVGGGEEGRQAGEGALGRRQHGSKRPSAPSRPAFAARLFG